MQLNIVRIDMDWDWFEKNSKILNDFWFDITEWKNKGIENHPRYNFWKK